MTARHWPRLRSWGLGVVASGWIGYRCVVPEIVGRQVQDQLAAHGFADSDLEVSDVALRDLKLHDVNLGDGFDLGDVDVDVGLSYLWGARPHEATIHNAHVTTAALEDGALTSLPVDQLHLDRVEVSGPSGRAIISGNVAKPANGKLSVELTATTASWRLGGFELRDVVVRAHDRDGGIRTCISARIGTIAGEACGTIPTEPGPFAVTWLVHDIAGKSATWTARGRGTLAYSTRGGLAVELTRGHVDVTMPASTIGDATIEGATATLDISGRASATRAEFDVHGDARAERVVVGTLASAMTVRDVRLPIAVHGALAGDELRVFGSLVARAREAVLGVAGTSIALTEPSIGFEPAEQPLVTARGSNVVWPREARLRAAAARVGRAQLQLHELDGRLAIGGSRAGELAVAWRSVTGLGPLRGAGELGMRVMADGLHVDRARIDHAGGQLSARPFVLAGPTELVLEVSGLQLGRLLPDRLDGTGLVDGNVVFRIDPSGASVVRGELKTRAGGRLRVADRELRERASGPISNKALHRRVTGALVDFEYTSLDAVLQPPGSDPELVVTAHGHGASIPQELALVVNVRGARDNLHLITSHLVP